MKSMVTIALMLLSSQAPTRQTDASLGTELHESYKAWFAALDRGDGAAMDALEVDDFILVAADGHIMEKHRPRVSVVSLKKPCTLERGLVPCGHAETATHETA